MTGTLEGKAVAKKLAMNHTLASISVGIIIRSTVKSETYLCNGPAPEYVGLLPAAAARAMGSLPYLVIWQFGMCTIAAACSGGRASPGASAAADRVGWQI